MTLTVHSAPGSYRGPDALDITRLGFSGKPDAHGVLFAPSWGILKPYKEAQREWEALEREAGDLGRVWEGAERFAYYAQADRMKRDAWATYLPAYTEEMRASYKANRSAWQAMLARTRLVLCCYCAKAVLPHCHRVILRGIFVKLGAVDGGEI